MCPRKLLKLNEDTRIKLAAALITRYSPLGGQKISSLVAKEYVPMSAVLHWGRVQIAEGGDKMCCREMIKSGLVGRDCTYVRVRLSISITLRFTT